MKSIWKSEVELPKRPALSGNLKVQNVVIGAGMAGILTAWFLQRKGQEVIVVEADRIAGGQTGNTTAKITSQHGLFSKSGTITSVGVYSTSGERTGGI